MNETDDLKELVQKAVAGDNTAFEELYRETCRSVYFTCLGFLKDEQEAQDVTQDVYLTAIEQLGSLKDADRFRPWLYRIAANKSIKRLRKKQPILPGDEQLEDMETEENENFLPEEYALNEDKREIVLKIIQETCSDVLYQTILLHYFNELSITEIAEVMECPEGTVKYRLSVARAKIKEGVLQYEKKSGDKLYSVAVIPFLTALFTAQMQDMQMPVLPLRFPDVRPKSAAAAQTAKTGGRIVLKGLQVKIAVGIAVVVVAAVGVAAVVTITNQRAEEASVGAQGEGAMDVAGLDNAADTDNGETALDEDTLKEEKDTADDSDMTDEPEDTEKAETGENETKKEAATAEATGTAEEAIAAETTPEKAAEPEYTYTDMSATMYATQTVNVRTLPSTDGEKVGSLSTNQEVNITGQCNETSWYRFEYNGSTAYVSNNYVSENKVEVAAAEPAASTDNAPAQETASAGASSGLSAGVIDVTTLPREQWLDYGEWFLYVHGVWDRQPDDVITTWFYGDIVSILEARYPDREVVYGHGAFLKDLGVSIWFVDTLPISKQRIAIRDYYAQFSQ